MINKHIISAAAILLFGGAFMANAQTEIAVSGTVTDSYGNPLPGVIVSANSKDLYITDKNGQYTAMAGSTDELTFSLVGYKQKTAKATATDAKIVLEDDGHGLAELVNLGYSKEYREVLSDAVATTSGDLLGKSLHTRLQQTLSGRLSGLTTIENTFEPTYEELSMYIRGLSTVHGGAAGVVIDGIFYASYPHDILYRISPEEVESISVLKDGASQAIYGVRGANGLLVINTKRGTPGKLKVGVNISETIEQPVDVMHQFDSYTYGMLRNQAAFNDGRGEYVYFSQETLDNLKSGSDRALYPNTDWADLLMRKASGLQRIAIDATGGSDRVQYFTTLNVIRQGSFWNADNERYQTDNEKYRVNFRSNIDVMVNKWIGLYMNLAGSVVKAHTPNGNTAYNAAIYEYMAFMPPTVYGPVTPQILDTDGETVLQEAGEVISTVNMGDSPYGLMNRSGYSKTTNTNIYGQGGLQFDLSFLTPGLWARAGVGYLSYITANQTTLQSYKRVYRDDDWNSLSFTQLGTTIDGTLGYGKGTALYGYMSYKGELGYQRDFGKHHVNANAYALYQSFIDQTGNYAATYDYRRMFTGAEVFYNYDKRYSLHLATGYSASDYFPTKTRWIWTPAVSAAWIASNESFIKENAPWLSLLKFRGSYAVTGNDNTGYGRYDYKDQVTSVQGGNISWFRYYTNESVYGNASLEPEKIKKANIGVDLGLGNQFTVSFDVFKERMDNGLNRSTALVPSYQGISLGSYPVLNMSQYENKGWELSVGYNKRFNADFGIHINGHLDYNQNKVIYVGESERTEDYAYRIRTEGYPYGQAWGYLVDWSNGNGLFNFQDEIDRHATYSFGTPRLGDIKFQDLNNDGVIDDKDQAPIAKGSLPRYSFGVDLGFTWKNFDFSVLLQGVGDYYRNFSYLYSYQSVRDGFFTESMNNAWTAEKWLNGETIDWPALSTASTTNTHTSDFFYRNASFLRIKNAEIAYRLPKRFSDSIGAGVTKIYLGGQNLFCFDKLPADMPVEGNNVTNLPVFRMYRIGVNVSF